MTTLLLAAVLTLDGPPPTPRRCAPSGSPTSTRTASSPAPGASSSSPQPARCGQRPRPRRSRRAAWCVAHPPLLRGQDGRGPRRRAADRRRGRAGGSAASAAGRGGQRVRERVDCAADAESGQGHAQGPPSSRRQAWCGRFRGGHPHQPRHLARLFSPPQPYRVGVVRRNHCGWSGTIRTEARQGPLTAGPRRVRVQVAARQRDPRGRRGHSGRPVAEASGG
jgi:hypothetical protein